MLFLLTLLTLLQQERKPDMKTPIETFSNWVRNGKDDGMEKNHFEPVSKMFDIIVNSKGKFSIIDAGCGNVSFGKQTQLVEASSADTNTVPSDPQK